MKFFGISLLGYALLVAVGCAPGFDSTLRVDGIPLPAERAVEDRLSGVRFCVDPITDGRSNSAVAEIGERELLPESDIAAAAARIISSRLRDAGGRPSQYNCTAVGGKLLNWKVRVLPEFPSSTASATAEIQLTVAPSPGGQPKFSTTYSAEFTVKNPLLREHGTEEAFTTALAYAIDGAIEDERFVGVLRGVQ